MTETSGTITDSAQVLDINQTHADATGNVVDIDNDGAGAALRISQDGTHSNSAHTFFLDNNDTSGQAAGLYIDDENTTNQWSTLFVDSLRTGTSRTSHSGLGFLVRQNGNGIAQAIDNNGTEISLNIDHDASSASAISGLWVNVANAGAGLANAAIFEAGNVGIGTTAPTALLHLKAGTATANTAPQKFTSGTLLTTPEAGAVEFDGSFYYLTI